MPTFIFCEQLHEMCISIKHAHYTIHPYCVNANLITDIFFEGFFFYLVRFLLIAYVIWALLLKTLNRVKLSLHLH